MENRHAFKDAIAQSVLKYAKENGVEIASRGGGNSKWLFDFRAIMMQSKWLSIYADEFWETYSKKYPFQVGGMETIGIALVAAIATRGAERGTPVNGFFIRKSRKKDGLMKSIEGTLSNDPIILVDDLLNSGGTFEKCLKVLDDVGRSVTDIFSIIRFRNNDSYDFAHSRHISVGSLFTLEEFGIPMLHRRELSSQPSTFRTVWRFSSTKATKRLVVEKSTPLFHRGKLYVGSDEGIMRCFDSKTGNVLWQYTIGQHRLGKGILSSPALHEETVYFGGYDGSVYALNAETGEKKWSYDDADWVGSSPAIDSDRSRLYIGLEFGLFGKKGGIIALDLESGEECWSDVTREHTHGSPLYIPEERLVVVGSNDHVLHTYDAETGKKRWMFATRGDIKMRAAYDPDRRLIAVNSMDGTCYVLDARDGNPIFGYETGAGIFSSPLIHDGILYIASLDKDLYAISLDAFQRLWRFETAGRIFSTPSIAESSLWIGSNDGRLYELGPKDGKLRGIFKASERIICKPAYDQTSKRFFVPTQMNEMYCIERNPQ